MSVTDKNLVEFAFRVPRQIAGEESWHFAGDMMQRMTAAQGAYKVSDKQRRWLESIIRRHPQTQEWWDAFSRRDKCEVVSAEEVECIGRLHAAAMESYERLKEDA